MNEVVEVSIHYIHDIGKPDINRRIYTKEALAKALVKNPIIPVVRPMPEQTDFTNFITVRPEDIIGLVKSYDIDNSIFNICIDKEYSKYITENSKLGPHYIGRNLGVDVNGNTEVSIDRIICMELYPNFVEVLEE